MLYELCYYLFMPVVALASSVGIMYYIDPEFVKTQAMNLSWNMTGILVDCQEIKEKVVEQITNISPIAEVKEEFKDCVMVFNNISKKTVITDYENKDELEDCVSNETNVILYTKKIGDKKYSKRFTKFEDLNNDDIAKFEPITKLFIMVEYIVERDNKEETIDIQEKLNKFYLNENIILDQYFLTWFLKHYHNVDIAENYSLRIFDKDVNMFSINKDKCIFIHNNTYTVVNRSEFFDERDDESEVESSQE